MTVNKAETAELLTFCAAYDQRTIGRADVEAWTYALPDVPWDDTTRQAVAAFYTATVTGGDVEAGRRFIQPHQVRGERARIRRERIERLPMPCPNDVPGVSEGDELRAIARAIGDGIITTRAQLAAYERQGFSMHLALVRGHVPALEGPEPEDRGPIRLDAFQRIPR